ncbi:sulfatase-like hydrolase/transferase [Micromonospora sp. 4G57]|uniref:Sulfatase-like hydrolase/transferase n=1 Tax=Micromonospora sicca TaxID=2202420 RepID=A0ABU5JH88_9ACTN|nr:MULTISPECIES: sulfatase-like hydrolase/transferase [unclassified Micromonospora]MDZ5446121.1 sulfatase-like hydrolase/transferase [Micromonospora sp. 4G57]MDZ5491995.1 sulfatase-like hydrolase/transferase [Micromonospora sp. 4G53]
MPGRPWRAELGRLLEVVALVGLVVTQPLLDVLGRSPDFFLFHRASRADILLLVALIAIAPTLPFALLGAVSLLAGRTARAAVHTLLVGLLLAALAVQVGRHGTPLRGVPLLLVAALAGAAGAAAHRRWRAPGRVLRVVALGPAVFVGLFVFASPASAVVLPRAHAGAAGVAGPGAHPPVVMIVLDELPLVSLLGPDGRIDATRYPHFAELAQGSTWYRNATGVSGWTPYALPAMLTGRYPAEPYAPHYAQYPDNLFTALGGLYEIKAEESITRLCPPSRCEQPASPEQGLGVLVRESGKLLRQVTAPVDSRIDPENSYRELTRAEAGLDAAEPVPADPKFRWDTLDDNQPARFTSFLAGLRPSSRPTLHFLHLLMPHSPWVYLPSGAHYAAPDDLPSDGAGWVDLARQRHLAQLGYTDRLIGETLRTLRASGLYDKALVLVTADHGVSFRRDWQGRGMDAINHAADQVAWVPMFVKEPGQRAARVDDRNWEHVDLLPTIADHAHIRIPWRMDGRSARQAPRERADKRFYDRPGQPVTITGGVPSPPATPIPDPLVGTRVGERAAGGTAKVANLAAFRAVDPAHGELPALVWGTVPAAVPDGTMLAVAVNGTVAAVVPVVPPDRGGRRFAALLPDDRLFTAGANRLDVYRVGADGALRRLALS